MSVSSVSTYLWDRIKEQWILDPLLQRLIVELQENPTSHPKYQWTQGMLLCKQRLVVGPTQSGLKSLIIQLLHSSPHGGHSGIKATLH